MMESGPSSALIMAEPQFLLELQIVPLDQPAYLRPAASLALELAVPAAVSSAERCRGGGGVSETAPAQLSRVAALKADGKRVEIWFQDEARIGQKNKLTRVWAETGSRPTAPRDLGFESAYLFGAVFPALGKAAAIVMPRANTEAMNLHLEEISCHVPADSHAIMFMDNAAWHSSKALRIPETLTLLPLPAQPSPGRPRQA